MEINTKITTAEGRNYEVIFRDQDPNVDLADSILQGVHGYCFCGDKIVICFNEKKNSWTLPGGSIEAGETYLEGMIREAKEEANMKILYQKYIGYQVFTSEEKVVRQAYSLCIVEPFGEFIADPDEDITKIKLVDPKEFKEYIN